MDFGLSPCACGLLGPVPKSIVEGSNFSRSSLVEGLMVGERLKAHNPNGKASWAMTDLDQNFLSNTNYGYWVSSGACVRGKYHIRRRIRVWA
jgi:hypothetical protein